MFSRQKIRDWLHRYLFAEVLANVFSIVFAFGGKAFNSHPIAIGYLGAIGDNVGFYGVIALKDYGARLKSDGFNFKSLYKTTRNIFIEFGPAEYLDSFILRPFFLALFPLYIDNFALAIFLGNMAANITFYIPTIFSYEMRKKYLD